MKKLLIASTALSLAGGAAFAEISISGSAELGVDYNSEAGEGKSKHTFVHDFGVGFTGSGTTDGGLSFSASAGFDNKTGGGSFDDGKVSVSGSFGTLSIGDVGRANGLAGGIADIGMNGIDVDDMVEDLTESNTAQLRYDNNFGQISIAISAGTATVEGEKGKMLKDAVEGVVGIPAVPAVPGVYQYKMPGDEGMGFGELFLADPKDADNGRPRVHADDMAGYQTAVVAHILGMTEEGDTLEVASDAINFSHDGSATDVDLTLYRLGGTGADPADSEDEEILYAIDGTAAPAEVTAAHVAAWKALAGAYGTAEDGGLDASGPAITSPATPGVATIVEPVAAVAAVEEVMAMDAVFAPDAPDKSETQYAFGMNFDAGGVTIGLGYDSNKTVSMGAGFSAGEVSTNLLYVKTDDDTTGIGADMTYTMGASAVTLAYGRQKKDEDEAMDAVGMGVTHDLGGGATMNAGFGKVGESNKASIGLMFTF